MGERRGPGSDRSPASVGGVPDPCDGRGRGRTVLVVVAVGLLVLLGGVATATGTLPPGVELDTDGDGLEDHRELLLGTDPRDPDTDGDRLPDGWEVAGETPVGTELPGSDPLHKDVYVQVVDARGVAPLTDREKRDVRAAFAGMNVSNPDGESGIALHLDDRPPDGGTLDRRVRIDGSRDRAAYVDALYEREVPADRQCVYHLLALVEIDDGVTAGYGDSPGYLAVVDGEDTGRYGSALTARVRYAVHELLHNVVGQFPDGSYHTDDGWLVHTAVQGGRDERLSNRTATLVGERGFGSPTFYRQNVCT